MLEKFFELKKFKTSVLTEFLAAFSTFLTMIYLLIINSNLIAQSGMPFEFGFMATILTLAFGCILAGVYIKKPFVVASYIAELTFGIYFVVNIMKYSYIEAISCAFIASLCFLILTFFNIRKMLMDSIPIVLKQFFPVVIGFFLILVSLSEVGIFNYANDRFVMNFDAFLNIKFILCFLCFLLIPLLKILKCKYNILLALLITFIIAILSRNIDFTGLNFNIHFTNTFFQIQPWSVLKLEFFPAIFALLILLFSDTNAILIAVKNHMKKEKIEIDEDTLEKAMKVDSICACVAPIFGSISAGVFPESSIMVEAKAKTGLSSIILGILFLFSIFLMPLIKYIPSFVSAGVLLYIGSVLIKSIKNVKIDTSDFALNFSALMMVILTCFNMNLAIGICSSFIIYTSLKVLSGKIKEVKPLMIILALLSLIFFMVYP